MVARLFRASCFCFFLSVNSGSSTELEPTLTIGSKIFTASELLRRSDLEEITITNDPAYAGQSMQYRAVRADKLFAQSSFREDDVIQVRCLDGFVAPISKDRMVGAGPGQSVAYIAIENPKAKWPEFPSKNSGTAGPFYLVWLRPELSGILKEEWPFKIVAFEVKGSLRGLYPGIFPRNQSDPKVAKGLKLFQKTCFACHTINHQGPSQMGPDLNLPMNPTEYLNEAVVPRYLRDPKSVRSWAASKMPGFGPETFSDDDIASIVAYLKEMAYERSHSSVH